MKKVFTYISTICFICVTMVMLVSLVACGGNTSSSSSNSQATYTLVKDGTLTVATSPDYPPMEFQEGGDIKGYDIALIKEIAKRLNLNVDVENQSFDSLVAQIAGGKKFDAAISSITINDERADQVAFTIPYYDSNLAIVVFKDSGITNRAQLAGQPIGVQSGSSGEDWAKENLKDSPITPFQETTDMLGALRTGKLAAIVYDEPVALNNVAKEYDDCALIEVVPTGEQYGIIANTDNPLLVEAMNNALIDMQNDGTIDKIKAEWFSAK